jgi:hypothetical protein
MPFSRQALEDAVAGLHALARADEAVARELDASVADYFPDPASRPAVLTEPARALATRRHLEWFLFERPSEVLGGVPAEALTSAHPEAAEYAEVLLGSLAGVFEVTGVEPERGLWLRDVFGLGEYPVDEPEAAGTVLPGDVAVGRVFPVGDAVFRLSPAAMVFRNAALLEALKRDVERLRAGRRGSLRIASPELERMFHDPSGPFGGPRAAVDPAQAERDLRAALRAGGAEDAFTDQLFAELRAAAREGRDHAITEALNRLAFDTEVDLETARARLLELWTALSSSPRPGAVTDDPDAGASPDAVADALARYDAGRSAGRDLEALFRSLETDLGIEPVAEADEEVAPDFPGVVAAVVQEFLWETGHEHGEEVARRYRPLAHLGDFASGIGVFENLSPRDVLEFAGRWTLDRGVLADASEAHALLAALSAFCRWCEEEHDLALWTELEATLRGLESSLPRLVELRRRTAPAKLADGAVYTFERARDGQALFVDLDGEPHEVELDHVVGGLLRNGDVVHAEITAGGEARVGACYPPELLSLAS